MNVYIKMLHYNRIGISESTYVNKKNEWEECNICHDWYFLNKGFKFQLYVCNRCHDLLMMFMSLSDIAILNIRGSDYGCIISGISKSEAINLMENINLTKQKAARKNIKFIDTY